METKLTAVEWFYQRILSKDIKQVFEQAKEMEKEQIIDAFGVGCQVESTRLIGYQDMASEYYNKTYKGGEQ